ncbi:hypothetical protein [Knoellia aerolata]|uniref:Uncharacterized protein n=1 Tax=Knoellia aerolata DSM 18566 TaxID=1385519 RepID=A0A0A0K0C1_9MICO|nr:hypothetical protein [Knoellia aerolata]KGN41782.1 hypothetical protein N801_04445 [Knoellia aerolata DSM 18566]
MLMRRLPFLLPGAVALLLGLDAGLQLLDLPAVPVSERLPDVHGMLLVLGFVGTLISLERAVALRRRPGYAAPALLGVGGLLIVPPGTARAGQVLLVAGSGALCLVYAALWRRQRDEAVVVQALGAVLALGAVILWLGDVPVPRLLPWLAGFVVLTIAGERLELARIDLARSGPVLLSSVTLTLAAVVGLLWPGVGHPVFGLALLVLVGWLATHDVARRTVRSTGLPRFAAVCLLAGYAWLTVAGALWLLAGPVLEGPAYDAAVHAVFLGFTLSMIMAHAPVILPAVLRVALPYHSALYVPAVLLHASLLVRVVGGDARGWGLAREVGGALNVAAVLCLVAVLLWSAATAPRPNRHLPTQSVGPAASSRGDVERPLTGVAP